VINKQNIQGAKKKLNCQRINDPLKKWAKELKRNFSKKEVLTSKKLSVLP
jgi:hypothetical protein